MHALCTHSDGQPLHISTFAVLAQRDILAGAILLFGAAHAIGASPLNCGLHSGCCRPDCCAQTLNFACSRVCRLDAPFGTEDKPVQVTSSFTERVVGVPDPYDDSIIWWGKIEVDQPPKQIIEGGEYFVLKQVSFAPASCLCHSKSCMLRHRFWAVLIPYSQADL